MQTPNSQFWKDFADQHGGALKVMVIRVSDLKKVEKATRREPYDIVDTVRQLMRAYNPPCILCGATVPTGTTTAVIIAHALRDDIAIENLKTMGGVLCANDSAKPNDEIQQIFGKLWGDQVRAIPITELGLKPGQA